MLRKKIFLASSSELKDDREQFEILLARKNKDWVGRGAFLELVVWEDFLDAVSQTRLQDEYNRAIRECDVFVMLFCTKVGRYTEEEFETAFGQFKATNKPLIYTYFKDAQITTGSANQKDLMSLWAFQEKLGALGHFYTVYKNIDELKFRFNQQLDKLAAAGSIGPGSHESPAATPGPEGSDLNISPVTGPRRITPLDGHPVLSPSGGPSPLYTSGFNVSFTLAHNGAGRHSINLHAMELEVVSFAPGVRPEYAYRVDGAELIGAGIAKPHVFTVTVSGKRVAPSQWVVDARRGTFVESRSANFFDLEDPRILTFSAGGGNEEIRGTVFSQEAGLYALRFVFHYSVAGVDQHKATEVIHVYTDE